MLDKILNTDYYRSLVQTFSNNVEFNSSLLPISSFNKINLSYIHKVINGAAGVDLIIKIPKGFDELIQELYSNFYLSVANFQFYENYINPEFNIGELVVRKIGKKNRKYKVVGVTDQTITLVEQKKDSLKDLNGPATLYRDKINVLKEFVPITRPLKKRSLNNYLQLFSSLYNLDIKEDFFPTKFDSVSIFIGAKKILDTFRDVSLLNGNLWNSIPSYYVNRDGKESDTLGIEPILYFAPSYSVAYQQLIQNKIKVSNIILFNDGFDELQQIISDQLHYKFRILGICSSAIEGRVSTIKYWAWHKEEINLIGSL